MMRFNEFLLLMGMLVAILIMEPARGAGGGQKSRGGKAQQKKAVEKSEPSLGITDKNLESRYVQLLFEPMEEEARSILKLKIDEFLLRKQTPKAAGKSGAKVSKKSGGAGSRVKSGKGADEAKKNVVDAEISGGIVDETHVETQKREAEAAQQQQQQQLLAQLHLAELKAILLQRRYLMDKSELCGKFIHADQAHLLAAKARMRGLIGGDPMFLELEMREPFVLRIHLIEKSEYRANFEKILSAPVGQFLETYSACRLNIPIFQGHLLKSMVKTMVSVQKGPMENVREEFNKIWKILLGRMGNEKTIAKKSVHSMAKSLYIHLIAWLQQEDIKAGLSTSPEKRDVDEQLEISAEHTTMALELFLEDNRLQTLIRQTRGARARLYQFLNLDKHNELQAFLAWTEPDLLDRLMQEYILVFKAKNEAERLKPQMSVDILIQVLFLDKHYEGNEAIQAEWLKFRQECLFKVEKMVDEDEDYAKDYGTLYNNMLFKLRNQQQPNRGGQWDLDEFFVVERQIAHAWFKHENAGNKKRPAFLVGDPQEETAQAEWLEREHASMLERLQQEHPKFKKRIKAIESKGEVLIRTLAGSHSKKKDIETSEAAAGEEKDVIYHKCPKDRGFYIRPDAKYSAYVEYMMVERDNLLFVQKGVELGLNALFTVYEAVIKELLTAFPATYVDKLRQEWVEESKSLLETEQKSIMAQNKSIRAKTHTVCKVHAFLLQRLITAELGPDVDDEARIAWDTKLRENLISATLVKLLSANPNYGNFDANCEPEVAQEVVQKLFYEEMPMRSAHFFYLDWLINEFDVFRRVICDVGDRLLAKGRMKELMGADLLAKIETMHPEILQIENMLPSSRIEYYDTYLNKLHFIPESSHKYEIRIAVPLLIGLVREIEAEFSSKKKEDKALMESHVNWLLEELFRDFAQLVSERSICLLFRFTIWNSVFQSQLLRGKQIAAIAVGEPSNLAAYSKENELAICGNVEAQLRALKWQRQRLTANHQQFLAAHKVGMNQPGRKTALQRLVPGLGLKWKKWTYTGDEQLGGHFLQALFLEDIHLAQRLSTTFGISFASWHRWVTAELGDGKGPAPLVRFSQIWNEWMGQRLARHDALFCADVQSQLRTKEYWAKMQAGIKDFLELQLPQVNEKGRKWQSDLSDTVTNRFLGKDPQWNARWNLDQWTEYNRWIQHKNGLKLLALWQIDWDASPEAEGGFKQRMLDGFVRFPEAKARLIHLIGTDHLSKVEEALGINLTAQDFPEAIDYMKADEHEVESSTPETNLEADIPSEDHQELSALQIWTRHEQAEFNKIVEEYASSGLTSHADESMEVGNSKSEEEPAESMDLDSPRTDDESSSKEAETKKMGSSPPLSGMEETKANALAKASKGEALDVPEIGERSSQKISEKQKSLVVADKSIHDAKITDELQKLLEENDRLLKKKGEIVEPKINVEEAINRLKTSIHQWDKKAFLLLTGSYQLGLYTAGSDIDCLVVLPHRADQDWKELYKEHFLGERQNWSDKRQKEGVNKKSDPSPHALDPTAPDFWPSPSTHASVPEFNPANLDSPDVHYFRSHPSTSAGNAPYSGHLMPPTYPSYTSLTYPLLPEQTMMGYPAGPGYFLPQNHPFSTSISSPTGSRAPGGYSLTSPDTFMILPSLLRGPRRSRRSPRRNRRSPSGSAEGAGPSEPTEVKDVNVPIEEEIICQLDDQRHCPNWSLYCMLCLDKEVKSLVRIPGQFPLIKVNFHGYNFKLLFVTFSEGIWKHVGNVVVKEDEENEKGSTRGGAAYGEIRILKKGEKDPNDNLGIIGEKGSASEAEGEEIVKVTAESATTPLQTIHSVDQLICAFVDEINVFDFVNDKTRKGMLSALSGYRSNMRIIELLHKHSKNSFRLAMLTLKLWAKRHFVSGGQFGLLNGTTLTILFVHVFLQRPEESVPALLAHFFDTYSRWNWPTPVELEPSAAAALCWDQNRHRHLLEWSEANEEQDHKRQLNLDKYRLLDGYEKLVWPVLTPGLPRQNAAFNINPWTARIIKREFKQSRQELELLHENNHGQQQVEIKENLDHWLGNPIKFENKYDHFVTIVCAFDKQLPHGSDFCDFVESRTRLQLLIAFGGIQQVKLMHANPEKSWHNRPCSNQMLKEHQNSEKQSIGSPAAHQQQQKQLPLHPILAEGDLCTIWLVGIQIVPTVLIGIQATMSPEYIAQILGEDQHFHKFVEPIRESFDRQQATAGRKMMAQKLMMKYFPRKELEEFIAGLN